MRVRRVVAHVLHISPLHCLCFKAASAHFRPQPTPLNALLVSADRSSSERFEGKVSRAPPASPQVRFKPGARKEVLFIYVFIYLCICISRTFVVVISSKSQAGTISKVFYARLHFGA